MSTTVVKIMIHGLIALAPSADDPNHITALLLDARAPLECVGEHLPMLSFRIPDTQEDQNRCRDAGCTQNNLDECICTGLLRNKEISLEITPPSPAPGTTASQRVDDSRVNNLGIPSDPNAPPANSLLYVANMTRPPFDTKLNPEYLAADPKVNDLFARMRIPSKNLIACSLSKREDQGEAYVLPMSLKILGEAGKMSDPSQAFAQMVVAKVPVKEGEPVKLHMRNFKGGPTISFVLASDKHDHMIKLSNAPSDLLRGDPCDDGVARHFAYFYEFAEAPPAWKDRLIPHVRFVKGLRAALTEVEECKDQTFNPNDRPICPMASFIP